MFFTSTYFFWALIFLTIPWVINFFTKKQIFVIKFPSLLFIKKAYQKEARKIKWQEILLLILRTLLILFLILSIMKPYRTSKQDLSKFVLQKKTNKSVIFILDNSYSMNLLSESETLFSQAKRLLNQIMDKTIKDSDGLCLLLSSDISSSKFYPLIYNKKDIIEQIKEAKISYIPHSLLNALIKAEKILDSSSHSERLIYLISDMQKYNFKKENDFLSPYLPIKYPIYFIKVESKNNKNSAVVNHRIPIQITFPHDSISFYSEIKNFSMVKNNLILKAIKENTPIDQKSISLSPQQKEFIKFNCTIDSEGYLSFYSEIVDGDNLIDDNRNYFVLYAPQNITINLVDHNKELIYLLNAINPTYMINKNIKSPFIIKEKDIITYNKSDDLLIVNYKNLDPSGVSEIKKFLLLNKSLLFFLSEEINMNQFNNFINNNLNLNASLINFNSSPPSPYQIEYTDDTHPIFQIFNDIPLFQNIHVLSYYKFNLPQQSLNTRVLARFSNGDPAIIEFSFQSKDEFSKNKIILFTFLLTKKNTDLIYSPNFLPLIQQTIKYLMDQSRPSSLNKFYTGQSLNDISSLLDIPPQPIKQLLGDSEYEINNYIVKPGIYQMGPIKFSVNLDYQESDLSYLSISEIQKAYKGLKIIRAENEKELNDKILNYSFSKPLSSTFFYIVLILLFFEMVLSNHLIKKILPYLLIRNKKIK